MRDKVVKFNKNAYFILPLLGINTASYGENAFINSYITLDKVIVLKLLVPKHTPPLAKKYLINAWLNEGFSMVAYRIPEKFYNEFEAFVEGRYSDFSSEAYDILVDSIQTEVVRVDTDDLTKDLIKSYMEKMQDAKHPIKYNLVGDHILSLAPTYLGAVAPKDHPQREALRLNLEHDLGMEIPKDAELYEKPNLEKELVTNEMLNDESKTSKQK